MNFKTFRAMIESIIKSFSCPMCQSAIDESSVEIIGAAGTTVNIDIECPACKKHALIKAEVAFHQETKEEKMQQVHDSLKHIVTQKHTNTLSAKTSQEQEKKYIDDREIVKLSQSLKNKKISVSELLGDA